MAELKFRVGDMVYTYQNPNYKARISHVRDGEDEYQNAYKVALIDDDGYSRSSKWINESSITKRRTNKWIKENNLKERIKLNYPKGFPYR